MKYEELNEMIRNKLDEVDKKIMNALEVEAHYVLGLSRKTGIKAHQLENKLKRLEKIGKVVSVKVGIKRYFGIKDKVAVQEEEQVVRSRGRPVGSTNNKKVDTPVVSRKGKQWTREEDNTILAVLNAYGDRRLPKGVTSDLCRRLKRPKTAIASRIWELRKQRKAEKIVTEKENVKVKGSYDYTGW